MSSLDKSANKSLATWTLESAVAEHPPGFIPPPCSTSQTSAPPNATPCTTPIPFFRLVSLLKSVKREGWRRFDILDGESVSDHMYRMALMTIASPKNLDAGGVDLPRATRMALVHDLAESLVGDITPADKIPSTVKSQRERSVMEYAAKELMGSVDGGEAGAEILALWEEYEQNSTPTAKWVKDIDKIELLLQMVEYEKKYKGKKNLGEFSYVSRAIQTDLGKSWAAEIIRDREAFWKSLGQESELTIKGHVRVDEGGHLTTNP